MRKFSINWGRHSSLAFLLVEIALSPRCRFLSLCLSVCISPSVSVCLSPSLSLSLSLLFALVVFSTTTTSSVSFPIPHTHPSFNAPCCATERVHWEMFMFLLSVLFLIVFPHLIPLPPSLPLSSPLLPKPWESLSPRQTKGHQGWSKYKLKVFS